MKKEEVDHINRNLDELCDRTFCNTLFLAKLVAVDVLSKADTEAISEEKGNINKAMKFYEIIKSRENAYSALITALENTRQTGVVAILNRLYDTPAHATEKPNSVPSGCRASALPSRGTSASVLVGEGQCTINAIVIEVEEAPGASGLLENWRKLARRLDISDTDKIKFDSDITLNRKQPLEVLESMLIIWKNRMASQATLETLLGYFEACGATDISDRLRRKFM